MHTFDTSDVQDHAHADISTAYASIKLWLLLARKAACEHPGVDASGALVDGEGVAAKMVWNELWPPFETVITVFEGDARSGTVSPLASSIWTSVADLFLFMRQSRSVIALDMAVPARILDRMKGVVRGESKVRSMRTVGEKRELTVESRAGFESSEKLERCAFGRLSRPLRQSATYRNYRRGEAAGC